MLKTGLSRRELRLGYWGEFAIHASAEDDACVARQAQDFERATQALVWVRIAVRSALPTLGPAEQRRTYDWLDCGQWESISRLKSGQPVAFAVVTYGKRFQWSVSPVVFLPLVRHLAGPPTPRTERLTERGPDLRPT